MRKDNHFGPHSLAVIDDRDRLFGKTTLPTPLVLPTYIPGNYGPWRVTQRHGKAPHLVNSYFSPPRFPEDQVLLYRREASGPRVWMSLTVLENESQAIPVSLAAGTVVVMGLGLGLVTYNLAIRPEVKRVIVIERDLRVIRLLEKCIEWGSAGAKIEIVNANALTWRPSCHVDLLYADIWPRLGGKQALRDTQAMQRNVNASGVYYWGQEIEAQRWMIDHVENDHGPYPIEGFKDFCVAVNLPLIGAMVRDYPNLIYLSLMNYILTIDGLE